MNKVKEKDESDRL